MFDQSSCRRFPLRTGDYGGQAGVSSSVGGRQSFGAAAARDFASYAHLGVLLAGTPLRRRPSVKSEANPRLCGERTAAESRPCLVGLRQRIAGARIAFWLLACCLMGLPHTVRADDASIAKEHEVKAAFIYNFLKFVEWPASRFGETNAPLVIGVVGKSPIAAALESAVQNRKLNGRHLIVKTVETYEDARTAHLLFVPASEDNRLAELLPALADSGVLTVGESAAFAKQGGIINFVLQDGKLRFEINVGVVERAGLKISAQLQKLAKTVRKE
jgi:hypothetical protein